MWEANSVVTAEASLDMADVAVKNNWKYKVTPDWGDLTTYDAFTNQN